MMRTLQILIVAIAMVGAVRVDEDPVQQSGQSGPDKILSEAEEDEVAQKAAMAKKADEATEAALKASNEELKDAAQKAVADKVVAEHMLNKDQVVEAAATSIQEKLHHVTVVASNDAEVMQQRALQYAKQKTETGDAFTSACTVNHVAKKAVPVAERELEDTDKMVDEHNRQYAEARMNVADAKVLKNLAEASLKSDEAAVDEARGLFAYKAKEEQYDLANLEGLQANEEEANEEVKKAKKAKAEADEKLGKDSGEEHASQLKYDAAQREADHAKLQKDFVDKKVADGNREKEEAKAEPVVPSTGPLANEAVADRASSPEAAGSTAGI